MESLQLNGYDIGVLAVFLLFVIRGTWLGLLKQVVPLLALYLGYIVASQYHDELLPFLAKFLENPKLVFIGAYVILFVGSYIAVALLGKIVAKLIQITVAPWFDRVLGALLGFAKALIVVVVGHMLIGATVSPENQLLQTCLICPKLGELTETTRKIIKDEKIRSALKQQKPAIAIDSMKDTLGADSKAAPGREEAKQ